MKVELCPVRRAIIVEGGAHRLPDLSFRMLNLLVSRTPDPVSFSEIEQAVWNAQVTRETIKQRVTLLRESLEKIGIDGGLIEAVRNHGYRTTLHAGAPGSQPRKFGRAKTVIVAGAILIAAMALILGWSQRGIYGPRPGTLAVVINPLSPASNPVKWEELRRDVVRAISKFEGLQVIDAPRSAEPRPDFIVRLASEDGGLERAFSSELIDGHTGAILFAEKYQLPPDGSDRAVLHFANNVHAHVSALSASNAGISGKARARYAEAYRLWRLGDRQSLLGARDRLRAFEGEAKSYPLVRSLLARVQSDLVLRHNAPRALARQAELEMRILVARQPSVGEFRYSLSRTLLAQGKFEQALDQLRVAQRTMPFLSRDIIAIEKELQPVPR